MFRPNRSQTRSSAERALLAGQHLQTKARGSLVNEVDASAVKNPVVSRRQWRRRRMKRYTGE